MKNNLILLFTFAFLMTAPSIIFAADNPQKTPDVQPEVQNTANTAVSPAATKTNAQNPADKLSRGIINIVTSPVEIAKQVDLSWKQSVQQSNHVSSSKVLSGFVKGLAYTVGRMGSGIWDVVSFPFKTPNNYEPLMKPDFVLDKTTETKK